MSLNSRLLKLQFKADHLTLLHRVAILSISLISIFIVWLILSYIPQMDDITEVSHQIDMLKKETIQLVQRNDRVLEHVKKHDMDSLITQYHHLKDEMLLLDEQLARYHNRYIDSHALAKLLYDLLKDMHDIHIENFSTIVDNKPSPIANPITQKTSVKSTTTNSNKPPIVKERYLQPSPELTHYSLSLKGNYFAIMAFLQRIENLKWELFWDTLNYQVIDYPQAVVTVEFFTLKPPKSNALTSMQPISASASSAPEGLTQ